MTNRCVDIIIGMQFGSEAKGKFLSVLPQKYDVLVRTGACNAAHTVYDKTGKKYLFHQLPCGSPLHPKAKLVLGANAQIDLEYLNKEIKVLKDAGCWLDDEGKPRLIIDEHATIIDDIDKVAESGGKLPECGELYFHPRDCDIHNTKLNGTCMGCEKVSKDSAWVKLGSTTHGSGANSIRKILRGTKMAMLAGQPLDLHKYFSDKFPGLSGEELNKKILEAVYNGAVTNWAASMEAMPVRYVTDLEELKPYVCDTVKYLNKQIDLHNSILLEGTQGAHLSLHHGFRGKTTSRDTNAAVWCSEAGISPLAIRDVYGVARYLPIRVAGDSGPMGQEITWDEVTKMAESPTPIIEITSATKRVRRVALFNDEMFQKSVMLNRPTHLMLTFMDVHHHSNTGKSKWEDLHEKTRAWILDCEKRNGVFFEYLSTGPKQEETIVR